MGIISWIILGALSGWIVSMLVKTNAEQGFIGNIVVGIMGAVIGGFLGSRIFDEDINGVNLKSILIAVAGGLIFTYILKLVTGKKSV